MPMCHKAYAFDWAAFERDELPELLSSALETGDTAGLLTYVERNRQFLKNPYDWNEIDDALPEEDRDIFLGSPFGPRHNRFDPGRYGSYFQTPERVVESLAFVRGLDLSWLDEADKEFVRRFVELLEECVAGGLGLYVTF